MPDESRHARLPAALSPYEELKELKREIREWEHGFFEREGRKPDKQDIHSDRSIVRQYKAYAKLKTALEEPDCTKKDSEPHGSRKHSKGHGDSDSEHKKTSRRRERTETDESAEFKEIKCYKPKERMKKGRESSARKDERQGGRSRHHDEGDDGGKGSDSERGDRLSVEENNLRDGERNRRRRTGSDEEQNVDVNSEERNLRKNRDRQVSESVESFRNTKKHGERRRAKTADDSDRSTRKPRTPSVSGSDNEHRKYERDCEPGRERKRPEERFSDNEESRDMRYEKDWENDDGAQTRKRGEHRMSYEFPEQTSYSRPNSAARSTKAQQIADRLKRSTIAAGPMPTDDALQARQIAADGRREGMKMRLDKRNERRREWVRHHGREAKTDEYMEFMDARAKMATAGRNLGPSPDISIGELHGRSVSTEKASTREDNETQQDAEHLAQRPSTGAVDTSVKRPNASAQFPRRIEAREIQVAGRTADSEHSITRKLENSTSSSRSSNLHLQSPGAPQTVGTSKAGRSTGSFLELLDRTIDKETEVRSLKQDAFGSNSCKSSNRGKDESPKKSLRADLASLSSSRSSSTSEMHGILGESNLTQSRVDFVADPDHDVISHAQSYPEIARRASSQELLDMTCTDRRSNITPLSTQKQNDDDGEEIESDRPPDTPLDPTLVAAAVVAPMSLNAAKSTGVPSIYDTNGLSAGSSVSERKKVVGSRGSIQAKDPNSIPLELNGTVQIAVSRKRNLLEKAFPTFVLHNEADGNFLLAARKRKKSVTVQYVISMSEDDWPPLKNVFILQDMRPKGSQSRGGGTDGLPEIACVQYARNALPREIHAAIPAMRFDDDSEPQWNTIVKSHFLNFGNFQLVLENNDAYIVMQFGRKGPDEFSLDVRWPLTPLEGFAIALSAFDAYDSIGDR
ncbi:hypothetical protein BC829DRAFT_388639 [Chytridium lagenaria]|nr:hypothetical protein BC829DRAFT_388639 [Chytridium lagenaria]